VTGDEKELVTAGIRELGLPAEESRIRKVEIYLDELTLWNKRFNLVRFETTRDLIVKHLLDSLSGVALIAELEDALPIMTMADVGSGAGFPGVPLALFCSSFRIDLIERSSKRARFLNNIRALLRLSHVRVLNSQAAELGPRYGLVTARALGGISEAIGDLTGLTRKGGGILLYKGKTDTIRAELELVAARPEIKRYALYPVRVPFLEADRNLVYLEVD
jgi:16S rRNA (guanine527-N7)-methyltransferase